MIVFYCNFFVVSCITLSVLLYYELMYMYFIKFKLLFSYMLFERMFNTSIYDRTDIYIYNNRLVFI